MYFNNYFFFPHRCKVFLMVASVIHHNYLSTYYASVSLHLQKREAPEGDVTNVRRGRVLWVQRRSNNYTSDNGSRISETSSNISSSSISSNESETSSYESSICETSSCLNSTAGEDVLNDLNLQDAGSGAKILLSSMWAAKCESTTDAAGEQNTTSIDPNVIIEVRVLTFRVSS